MFTTKNHSSTATFTKQVFHFVPDGYFCFTEK